MLKTRVVTLEGAYGFLAHKRANERNSQTQKKNWIEATPEQKRKKLFSIAKALQANKKYRNSKKHKPSLPKLKFLEP